MVTLYNTKYLFSFLLNLFNRAVLPSTIVNILGDTGQIRSTFAFFCFAVIVWSNYYNIFVSCKNTIVILLIKQRDAPFFTKIIGTAWCIATKAFLVLLAWQKICLILIFLIYFTLFWRCDNLVTCFWQEILGIATFLEYNFQMTLTVKNVQSDYLSHYIPLLFSNDSYSGMLLFSV